MDSIIEINSIEQSKKLASNIFNINNYYIKFGHIKYKTKFLSIIEDYYPIINIISCVKNVNILTHEIEDNLDCEVLIFNNFKEDYFQKIDPDLLQIINKKNVIYVI